MLRRGPLITAVVAVFAVLWVQSALGQQQLIEWSVVLNAGGFDQQEYLNCTSPAACQNSNGGYFPTSAASDSSFGSWPPGGEFMFRNELEARPNTVFLRNITVYAFMGCCSFDIHAPCGSGQRNMTRVRVLLGGLQVFHFELYPNMICDPLHVCLSCPFGLAFFPYANISNYNTSRSAFNSIVVEASDTIVLNAVVLAFDGDYMSWNPIPLLTVSSGSTPPSSSGSSGDAEAFGLYLTLIVSGASVLGMYCVAAAMALLLGVAVFVVGRRLGRASARPLQFLSVNADAEEDIAQPAHSPPRRPPPLQHFYERVSSPKAPNIRESWRVSRADLQLVGSPIGQGANGVVYRGLFRGLDVAVKVFTPAALSVFDSDDQEGGGGAGGVSTGDGSGNSDSSVAAVFLREMELLSGLRHPNVVLFIGACATESEYFMITELIARGSLADVVRRLRSAGRGLSYKRQVLLLRQIARGMAYLHAMDVVHRDLKAANVLVDANWVPKIADFGVARVGERDAAMTQTGTLRWMSPEVLESGKNLSKKTDVWSFGVLVYETGSGRVPYEHIAEEFNVMRAIAAREALPAAEHGVHPTLCALLDRCMSFEPDMRPYFSEIGVVLEAIDLSGEVFMNKDE